jgi:hypothetical protein
VQEPAGLTRLTTHVRDLAELINAINGLANVGNVIIASRGKGIRNPSSTGKPRYPTVVDKATKRYISVSCENIRRQDRGPRG